MTIYVKILAVMAFFVAFSVASAKVAEAQVSQDARFVMRVTDKATMRIENAVGGQLLLEIPYNFYAQPRFVAVSGTFVAIGFSSHDILIYEQGTNRLVTTLGTGGGKLVGVHFSRGALAIESEDYSGNLMRHSYDQRTLVFRNSQSISRPTQCALLMMKINS